MNTDSICCSQTDLKVGSLLVTVNRKEIKNLHITVLPPDGAVRVSAPIHFTDQYIRMAIAKRLSWIRNHQRNFQNQPRQSDREMISGESHYLFGRRYLLDIVHTSGEHKIIKKNNKHLTLTVQPNTSRDNRYLVLQEFYRAELRKEIAQRIKEWQDRIGVVPKFWGIRIMQTKWGSCNTDKKRIWFNLELAKKPYECIDYIIVHELLHLLERRHSTRFYQLLDKFYPNWHEAQSSLNKSILPAFE